MKLVQIRVVYVSSILIPEDIAAKWSTLTHKERCDVMWGSNPSDPDLCQQDPSTQFSCGQMDMNDPFEIEFLGDPDDFEDEIAQTD